MIRSSVKPYVSTMKKVVFLFCMIIACIVFSFSRPLQNAPVSAQKFAIITYEATIATLVEAKCAPCHFPAKGGKKKSLDSYTT